MAKKDSKNSLQANAKKPINPNGQYATVMRWLNTDGFNLSEVGRRAGISPSQMNLLKNGVNKNPSTHTIQNIFDAISDINNGKEHENVH